jgi:arginyl-tRNA synthetase
MSLLELRKRISEAVGNAGEVTVASETAFGHLTTNAALVLSGKHRKPPRELAVKFVEAIERLDEVEAAEVAGPGFVNITLKDKTLADLANTATEQPASYQGQVVVTEYSDPNPFKVLHVGHLYTSVVGDAITNLFRNAGASVHPVNFGGDVGLHVGKTLWGILLELGGENPEKLNDVPKHKRAEWMAACYVAGTKAYDEDPAAEKRIVELNKRVYEVHDKDDHSTPLAKIYWECRQWSYDYFEEFYRRIGSKFDKYYPESVTAPVGLKTVREQLEKGVYERSDGAVVFRGEPFGLHTRVFITSQGLPTYETKDVGVLMAKWGDYKFDRSVVITGNDITEYMKVVLKSVAQFEPKLVERSTHITHGNVKLAGGVKMSSRRGNFLGAEEVLEMVADAGKSAGQEDNEKVTLGAVKYAFLKQRIGADLVFVPEESVSLEGNSGPYLQYAHARARSILRKAGKQPALLSGALEESERRLAWWIGQYSDVVSRATQELMPHHICGYLYELAQEFNRFYEDNRVLGSDRQELRLALVGAYASVLRQGLGILSIEAPESL